MIWKDIPEYAGLYKIREDGLIYSYRFHKNIRIYFNKSGYKMCRLIKDKKNRSFRVHRLVAFAFKRPPMGDRDCINHKDGIKINNHHSNLEWCTRMENNKHALETGLIKHRGDIHHSSILTERLVKKLRKRHSTEKISYEELGRQYNVPGYLVSRAVRRKTWKHVK